MLLVTAYVSCNEPDRDTVREAAGALVAKTQEEDGCDEYRLYEDTERPGRFIFVERWRDRGALDAHVRSDHFRGFGRAVGRLLTGSDVQVHDVASTSGL
jgi:quinol monooxygenase YgiN